MVYCYKKSFRKGHRCIFVMNPVVKVITSIGLILIMISTIFYLIFAGKDYFYNKDNLITAIIDFVFTEDTAFEILFILFVIFIIIVLL